MLEQGGRRIMKICDYCKKEIKENELYCTNNRYDWFYIEGEPIWHLDCYSVKLLMKLESIRNRKEL